MSDATEYLKLKKKLARYSEELTQLKLLESKLSSDLREYLDSTLEKKDNSNGDDDAGSPNEDVRKWLVEHIFKGNKKLQPQKIDQTLRTACSKETKAKADEVSAAIRYYLKNHKPEGHRGRSALWAAGDKLFA